MKKKTILILSAGLVVIVVIAFFLMSSGKKEIQFNTAKVEEATVQTTVTATGYVQPVDKVDVGTQVSGVIEKIYVDFNSQVKKGQLLAELDKSTLNEKLVQANASLVSAQSSLTFSQQNFDRIKKLYDAKAATQAAYEDAVNTLSQSKTSLANAKANLQQAQVNLNFAEIYSPIDGVVLNRAVEQGQTVAASFNTPTLFTIANDLTKMQVEANVDEADIGNVKLNQKVTFTVDAYSDDTFDGTVKQIRLQPTVTSNVVTYTVIVEAPNPEQKLFPGMTANISIITQSEKGLAVPAEALSFKPSEDIMKHLKIQSPYPQTPGKSNHSSGGRPGMGQPSATGMASATQGQAHGGDTHKGVWIQTGESIEFKKIKTGLNDGINALVIDGLKEGDTVVLSASLDKKTKQGAAATNPLMPRRPQQRK